MENKLQDVVVITGTTSGIGYETLRLFAEKGEKIVVGVRNIELANKQIEELKANSSRSIVAIPLDLASFESMDSFVSSLHEQVSSIKTVIHNAGVYMDQYKKTIDGFEQTLSVNYLAPYYLTYKLVPLLKNVQNSQVLFVSSTAAFWARIKMSDKLFTHFPSGVRGYAKSKILLLMFTRHFANEQKGKIRAHAIHPGVVNTNIFKGETPWMNWFLKRLKKSFQNGKQAAKTIWTVATDSEFQTKTGLFIRDQRTVIPYNKIMKNDHLIHQVMMKTNKCLERH